MMFTPLFSRVNPRLPLRSASLAAIAALTLSAVSCGNSGSHSDSDSIRKSQAGDDEQAFHADNDIAMVVRSLTDAMAVGEPFDSLAYTFTGVLTDGAGAPLYVDTSNNPGMWKVSVEAPDRAVITNINDGDLIAADLTGYITQCLYLDDSKIVDAHDSPQGAIVSYAIPNGYLTFEGKGPDGFKGCRIVISIDDTI